MNQTYLGIYPLEFLPSLLLHLFQKLQVSLKDSASVFGALDLHINSTRLGLSRAIFVVFLALEATTLRSFVQRIEVVKLGV